MPISFQKVLSVGLSEVTRWFSTSVPVRSQVFIDLAFKYLINI